MKKTKFTFVKRITPILSIMLISANLIVAQLPFSSEISNLSTADQVTYNAESSNWDNRNVESNLASALTTYENLLTTNSSNRTLLEKLSYGYWLKSKYIDSTADNKYNSWFNALTYSIDCLNLNTTYNTSKDINDLTASDYTCAVIKALIIKDFLISYGEDIYPADDSIETLSISAENSQTYIKNLTKLNSGLTESELQDVDENGELVYWREMKKLATESKELIESSDLFSGSINENDYYYLKNQILGTYYSKMPENYGQNLTDSTVNFELAITNGTDYLENMLEYAIQYANYNDKSLYNTLLTTITNTDISTLNSDLAPENTLSKAYATILSSEVDTTYGCLNDYDCDSIVTNQDCNDNYSNINVVSENITIDGSSYSTCDLAVIKLILDLNPANSISANSDIINQGVQEWSNNRLQALTLTNYSLAGTLPEEIDVLDQLVTLNLNTNSITSITDNISNLKSLNSLNLNQNDLTDFNIEITNLTNLKSLELNNNNISSEIPTEILYLTNIEVIDLSFNNIVNEIPSSILNLHNLITLKLNDNNISGEIPIQANMWSNIKNIYLQNNLLTGNIPFNIFDLLTVENLDLSCNRLRDYYGTFSEQESISLGEQDCN